MLGGLVARHLATAHGVSNVLLAGRRGDDVRLAALATDIERLGAKAVTAGCDVSDRTELAALLATVRDAHALTAVVHCAGVLDDGVVTALTPERLDRVRRAKARSAWHLHELTRDLDLSAFVLFSSAAGVLGAPGQANYAAANPFLDALAHHRRATGLPGTALACGPWDLSGGVAGEAELRRTARGGVAAVTPEEGLALFDAAVGMAEPVLVPLPLDRRRLRSLVATAHPELPVALRGLVPSAPVPERGPLTPRRTERPDAVTPARLAGTTAAARTDALSELVHATAASVLGFSSPAAIEDDASFPELGLDSLTAVEPRNRLATGTGLSLSATVVFDHPTPAALTGHLERELAAAPAVPRAAPPSAVEGIGALFRQARAAGRVLDGIALLRAASRILPSFADATEPARPPRPMSLARGTAPTTLICFPAVVALSGAHQYARFAAALRGQRDVVAPPSPVSGRGSRCPPTSTRWSRRRPRPSARTPAADPSPCSAAPRAAGWRTRWPSGSSAWARGRGLWCCSTPTSRTR